MNRLGEIPVTVDPGDSDTGAPPGYNPGTGNIPLLLVELRHALSQLARHDVTTTIDLRSLPLAPGELDTLRQTLGRGEVDARLNALGPSEIVETSISGVWWVTHYNQNEEIIGIFLEVTTLPQLLQTPSEDLQAGIEGLDALINHERES